MPVPKLREFLDEHAVRYVIIIHSKAYTALEIAESAHVSGKQLAKTVIVTLDGRMAMAVLPGSARVDLERLREAAGASRAELATEKEFQDAFPDCEVGAMPPFGNLYGLEVFAAPELSRDEEIAFNAGSHGELVRMRYEDFATLVSPRVVDLTAAT